MMSIANISNPHARNQAIIDLIQANDEAKKPYTKAEIQDLLLYSGGGGMQKHGAKDGDYLGTQILSQFFTPKEVAAFMVELAMNEGYTGGKVLEPSCGTGVFLQYLRPSTEVDAYEIDPVAHRIAQLRFAKTNFNIHLKDFSSIFTDRRKALKFSPSYDLVIGNPPYGGFTGKYASMEKRATKAERVEDYFIIRGLDLLKEGGLLVYIIGTEPKNGGIPFLRKGISKAKKEIAKRAEVVRAFRLPPDLFDNTSVLSEIVVLKKNSR